MLAHGDHADGGRPAFLRGLVARGLSGVRLVTSDATSGWGDEPPTGGARRDAFAIIVATVVAAAGGDPLDPPRRGVAALQGPPLCDVLAHVPKTAQGMVAAFARTIWAQPDAATTHARLGRIAEQHNE